MSLHAFPFLRTHAFARFFQLVPLEENSASKHTATFTTTVLIHSLGD